MRGVSGGLSIRRPHSDPLNGSARCWLARPVPHPEIRRIETRLRRRAVDRSRLRLTRWSIWQAWRCRCARRVLALAGTALVSLAHATERGRGRSHTQPNAVALRVQLLAAALTSLVPSAAWGGVRSACVVCGVWCVVVVLSLCGRRVACRLRAHAPGEGARPLGTARRRRRDDPQGS
jgi:hypothetical protein